jgi:DNA polymerase III alpha subunit
MGYLREDLLEKGQEIYDYYKDIQEYEQRILDIKARKDYNENVIPKIEKRNQLRKLVKKYERQFAKNKREISELDFEKIKRDLEELEELKLKKMVSLKEKPEPKKPALERYEKIKLSFKEVVEQANYIGCYIDIHPVNLIRTPSDKINDVMIGEYARIAGVITMLKVIKTRKTNKNMAFIEIDDSHIIAEGVIFPNAYKKIEHLDLKVGSLILADIKMESTDPYKMIVNSIILYEG